MAGLVTLHCGNCARDDCPLWAECLHAWPTQKCCHGMHNGFFNFQLNQTEISPVIPFRSAQFRVLPVPLRHHNATSNGLPLI